jgi:hypothetical protein
MIRLLQRRGDLARSELDELKRMLSRLRSSPAQTRSAVGAGVYLANTDFMRRFGGMEGFCRVSHADREEFYSTLSDLESSLGTRELGMALGVGLYRIWLAEVAGGRRDAAEMLGEELTELSRRASGAQPPGGQQ